MSHRSFRVLSTSFAFLVLMSAVVAQARDFRNYTLRLGDQVQVRVADHEDLALELSVFTTGEISYPGVGKLVFHGKTPAQLETQVAASLKTRGILSAEVSVLIKDSKPGSVYIQGAIHGAQAVELPMYRQLRISQLVAIAGGLAPDAEPKYIKLHRVDPGQASGTRVITVDYDQVASGANAAGDMVLQDGDSIFVPRRVTGTFAVAGEIARAGEYAMPRSGRTTVARAILRAGGLAEYANAKKVKIVRQGQAPVIVDVNAIFKDGDSSKDITIRSGDMIIVPKRLF